jgi:hypothetical protein
MMAAKQKWLCREMLPSGVEPDWYQEGDLVFYANGLFRIGNRVFPCGSAVDFKWNRSHASRQTGDRWLRVIAGGEHFVFEYSLGTWYRWIAEVSSPDGTIDTTDLPHVSLLRRYGWRACIIAIMALVWMLWSGK